MTSLFDIGLLTAVVVAGWQIMRVCRTPVPAFLGSMLSAGILNYLYLYPDISLDIPSFISKVLIGITIGCRFDRASISVLRTLPIPALLTSVWMIAASLIAGYLLYWMSDLTLGEALVGSAAGGVTEMIIFSLALGVNVVNVAFIQLFRLVFVIVLIPFLAKGWVWHLRRHGGMPSRQERAEVVTHTVQPVGRTQGTFTRYWYLLLAFVGCAVGGGGEWLGLPAGAMLGAMFGSGVLVMSSGRDCPLPSWVMTLAQLGLGTVVAQSLTHDTVMALGGLFGPLIAPTFILLVLCMLLSYILVRITGWDSTTCLLATMPAGLTQVVPIAEECGADVLKVGVLHAVRLISIVAILPWIIRLLIS